MTFSLDITLHRTNNVVVHLRQADTVIASKQWHDDNNFLEQFFVVVDVLLAQHSIEYSDLASATLYCDGHKGVTTQRIAQTIVDTICFYHKTLSKQGISCG